MVTDASSQKSCTAIANRAWGMAGPIGPIGPLSRTSGRYYHKLRTPVPYSPTSLTFIVRRHVGNEHEISQMHALRTSMSLMSNQIRELLLWRNGVYSPLPIFLIMPHPPCIPLYIGCFFVPLFFLAKRPWVYLLTYNVAPYC